MSAPVQSPLVCEAPKGPTVPCKRLGAGVAITTFGRFRVCKAHREEFFAGAGWQPFGGKPNDEAKGGTQ